MPTKDKKLNVFLSYSRNDKVIVRELYQKLSEEGWINPWMDIGDLLPGQTWKLEIENAIDASDIIIIFLSRNSVTKEGYLQREIKQALEKSKEKLEGAIYVIPFRLEELEGYRIPSGLTELQYVDYFPEATREEAYSQLLKALESRGHQLKLDRKINFEKRRKQSKVAPLADVKREDTTAQPIDKTKEKSVKKQSIELPAPVVSEKKSDPPLLQKKKINPLHWVLGLGGTGLCIILVVVLATTLPELLIRGFIGAASLFYPATPTATYPSMLTPFIENSQPTEQTEVPYDVTVIPETPTATSEPQSFTALPGSISEVKWNSFTSEQLACMSSKYVIPVDGLVSAEFLPGGQAVAVQLGSSDPQIGIWNLEENSWSGQIMPGNMLSQTKDGPMYMVIGYEQAEIYSAETNQLVFVAPEPNEDPIGFSSSHNGKYFAFSYQSGKIIVYDRPAGTSFTVFAGLTGDQIVFSQDDRFFATGNRYAPISIWNTEKHSLVAKLKTQSSFFSFSRDGQYLIYVGYPMEESAFYILAYSLHDQSIKKIIPVEYIWGERDQVRVYMSIENDLYGIGGSFWELSTNTPIRSLQEHEPSQAVMVTGSLEGDQLISVGYDKMIVWDLNCAK